ncbi:hypothetical protein FRC14_000295 [Serendipita sp. 396]|nr:hypothetical protein FRC14_000295 [Serendipita sp. 396]KAG8867223.1 hypothetical protein FRC20_006310 [Serendipita sp. 405]
MKDSKVKGESKPKTAEKKGEKGHSKSYQKGEKENHRKKITQNRERDHEPIVQRTKDRVSEENQSDIALKSAIEALGGLEDDYELVINAPSDDEVSDASAPVDPSLQKDVAKLVKELGFSRHKRDKSWTVENIDGSDVESSEAQRSESEQETRLETTTPQPALPAKSNVHNGKFVSTYDSNTQLISLNPFNKVFPPSPRWYEALESLPVANVTHPSEHTLETLMSRASSLLDKDVSVYASTSQSTGASSSDAAFLSRVLSSGTLSDRLSALTLMVQASPVHNIRALEGLKALAMKKGGKGEGLKGVRAIVDWWIGGGAPERKLRYSLSHLMLLALVDYSWTDTSETNHCFMKGGRMHISLSGILKIGSRNSSFQYCKC